MMPAVSAQEMTDPHNQMLPGGIAKNKRGLMVYSLAQLQAISGVTKTGEKITGNYEQPYFALSVEDREMIVQRCAPVLGIVAGRCKRMAGLEWNVVPKTSREDQMADAMKEYYSLFREYSEVPDIKYRFAAMSFLQALRGELPDMLPDGSNFNASLMRWKRRLKATKTVTAEEIEDWLRSPNSEDDWEDFVSKYTHDQMVHGCSAIYKEYADHRVRSIYILPGGSVIPLRSPTVGAWVAYAQMLFGQDPQIYFQDEVVFTNYLPKSSTAFGHIPLEALVNKVAESLLFDQLMAEQADGSKPPEKIIIMGEKSPFGDPGAEDWAPIDQDEQRRIETKVNTARKMAVAVMTGTGVPTVVDLSRENTMSTQLERQKMIREEAGLVFGVSNLELNMSDSGGVSGRSTSESLETIDQNKGLIPIARALSTDLNKNILPYRFGSGFLHEFKLSKDEMGEINRLRTMKDSGLWSVNEIRTDEMGEDPFPGEEFNLPQGMGMGQPGLAPTTPFYTQGVE